MFDDKEVFYGKVDEENAFVYAKYKTLSYYRTSRDNFDKNSSFIEQSQFTKTELEIHRPDLPLRLNCFSGLFWPTKPPEKQADFDAFLVSAGINNEKLEGLDNSKVVLIPNSQQQSNKKPVLLENIRGFFSGQDLVLKCLKVQSEYVKSDRPYFSRLGKVKHGLTGIGMYRLGIKGNVPSYYLGGEMSMMEWFIIENK